MFMGILIFSQHQLSSTESRLIPHAQRWRRPREPGLSPEGEEGTFQDFLSWPLFPNQCMGEWGKGEADRASGGLASGTPASGADATSPEGPVSSSTPQ